MTRHRAEKRTDTIDDDDCLAIFSGESVVIEFNEPQRLTLEANLPVKMKMRMLCACGAAGADWNDDGGRKHETPNSFAEKRCQASCKRWLAAAVREMCQLDWTYTTLYGKNASQIPFATASTGVGEIV